MFLYTLAQIVELFHAFPAISATAYYSLYISWVSIDMYIIHLFPDVQHLSLSTFYFYFMELEPPLLKVGRFSQDQRLHGEPTPAHPHPTSGPPPVHHPP